MKEYQILLDKIKNKSVRVGVIGLGYVGLPLAVLFAAKGFKVTGFVRTKEKINSLKDIVKNKFLSIKVTNSGDLQAQDIIIVCVPTPVDKEKNPNLTDLITVSKELSKLNLKGKLVVNESTVAPFTTREIFGKITKNCFLACSPERVDPGNEAKTTENIKKVIGGKDRESLILGKSLYEQVLKSGVVEVGSLEAAEMAKMLENTYRAVNIALVNEFAKLAEKCNVDILEVIEAAKTKWSFQAHYPGIGVGGHCIPVDPYYLLELAKKYKIDMKIVKNSLLENESMPEYLAEKVKNNYKKGMRVLVYGLTYKKDIDDVRESPVITLCRLLKKLGIDFAVFDPLLREKKIKELGFKPGILEIMDIFIVGTDHNRLTKDYQKAIREKTLIIDGRNFFASCKGKKVLGVGRTLG